MLCLIALIKVLRVNLRGLSESHSYSGLFDSIAKPFGTVFVQVWFPYLRETDILRTISKDECRTSKKFFRK